LGDTERGSRRAEASVDALFAEALRAGEDVARIRETLERALPDQTAMFGLLRRALPVRFLEFVAATPPWSDDPRILGAVARNPRAPRALALKLLPFLSWNDLAAVAGSPWVQGGVRARAEGLLGDMLPDMRLGERITLGKVATAPVLSRLLLDSEAQVVEAALQNPRLREEDLLVLMRDDAVAASLLEQVARSPRWSERYAVRLGLVLQPRTPLALALAQVSSLVRRDLLRVAETPGLRPILQAAALRVADGA
jgi:hypothetical protein